MSSDPKNYFLTAGHLVYLRPCPAAGHLDTAFRSLISRIYEFLFSQHPEDRNYFEMDFISRLIKERKYGMIVSVIPSKCI